MVPDLLSARIAARCPHYVHAVWDVADMEWKLLHGNEVMVLSDADLRDLHWHRQDSSRWDDVVQWLRQCDKKVLDD